MLENWLKGFSQNDIDPDIRYHSFQLGYHIRRFETIVPDLDDVKLALIGVGEQESNAVRRALYDMSFPFGTLRIADLGNIRKKEVSFIVPLITELLNSDIIPIVIGDLDFFALAQYQAYQTRKEPVNLAIVDELIRYSPNRELPESYLHQIFEHKHGHLFHCSVLSYQSHFTPPAAIDFFDLNSFDHIRLGKVRADLEETEPLIRDADLLCFHLGALRQADAPGQINPSPSGLSTEEACQISRYAGMSDKLSSIGFYGFDPSKDRDRQTEQVIAQMLWYFVDGFNNRKNDYPVSTDHLMEYIVDIKESDNPVTFWKSNKSGRWWMQIPVKTRKKLQRHRLVPCSYQDYQHASRQELPERLVNAFKRFE